MLASALEGQHAGMASFPADAAAAADVLDCGVRASHESTQQLHSVRTQRHVPAL